MAKLRDMIAGREPVLAPLVLNPLMAKLAENAGFRALYLGGGATGYLKIYLEATLTVTEMCQAAIEIGAATPLPLIFDAAAGFGDPMHMRRTIAMSEAAGFQAIEIEDQWLPKRAHHHIGLEHMVEKEIMAAKVAEAVRARRGEDLLIVARTNAVRASNMDDALARVEAYRAAGADLLLLSPRNAEEARFIAERLGGPLMYLASPGGMADIGLSAQEMADMGWKIIADPQTQFLALYERSKALYREMAASFSSMTHTPEGWRALQDELHDDIGLEVLLDIERRTVEKG
ncbi:MAG: isocitrate lyase/PEP mutase family protein [Alphaproteobacteria bacterium]|nr:isocitrate lyase/PEP mutase family protein [Alphaproteobacteria bacterium]